MKMVEDFRSRKSHILKHIKKEGIDAITLYCTLSGVPLIAAYTFIMEDMPEYKEICEKKIQSLINFYKY